MMKEPQEEGWEYCILCQGKTWHKWVELPEGSYYLDGKTTETFECVRCLEKWETESYQNDED